MSAAGLYGKELVPMVTYSDLIQFVIMLCAVVSLVVIITRKKQHPLLGRLSATFLVTQIAGGWLAPSVRLSR